MKVLFVGDGNHDVGVPEFGSPARPATGVVPALTRKIASSVSPDSIAPSWIEVARYSPNAKRGYDAKVKAAELLATRMNGCDALVCVVDADGDRESRAHALAKGAERVAIPVAFGVAVESIEAWTLAVPEAIAAELGLEVDRVRRMLPKPHVETLRSRSGKQQHRPKPLLERIAALGHRAPDVAFRSAVANRTDIAALEHACPSGFKPFAETVRRLATS